MVLWIWSLTSGFQHLGKVHIEQLITTSALSWTIFFSFFFPQGIVFTVSGSGWHIHYSPGILKHNTTYSAVGVIWGESRKRLLLGARLMEEFIFFLLIQRQPSSNSLLLYVGLFWLLQANTLALAIMRLVLASFLSPVVVHMQNPLLFCCQDDSLFFKPSCLIQCNQIHSMKPTHTCSLFFSVLQSWSISFTGPWLESQVPVDLPMYLFHWILPAFYPIVVRSILKCAFS